MRYAIVIEKVCGANSAYVPDLPGCIATGATLGEVRLSIAEAIGFHIEGLRTDGEPVPLPSIAPEPSDDPFIAFTEWAGEADDTAYADL